MISPVTWIRSPCAAMAPVAQPLSVSVTAANRFLVLTPASVSSLGFADARDPWVLSRRLYRLPFDVRIALQRFVIFVDIWNGPSGKE